MLTDDFTDNVSATDELIKRSDAYARHINVPLDGRKNWRFACRFKGAQKTLIGGPYPQVSLNRARICSEGIRALVAVGTESMVQRGEDAFQAKAAGVTFERLHANGSRHASSR